MGEAHGEAVREQMMAPKGVGVPYQLVEIESNRRVVGADHGARTHANQHLDRNAVTHQLSKDADMSGATKAAGAEHNRETNRVSHRVYLSQVFLRSPRTDKRASTEPGESAPLTSSSLWSVGGITLTRRSGSD